MVLEGAAADDAASVPRSDTPLSDADRFSSSPTTPVLDYTTIANPVPILGPLLGYNRAYYDRELHALCRATSRVVARPLEADEAQALAEVYSTVIAAANRGQCIGALIGGTQAYRGAREWRFPFLSPNLQTFNPNKFGPLAGQPARIAWHAVRASPYVAFWYLLGAFAYQQFALFPAMRAMQSDPRLTEVTKVVEQKMASAIEKRRSGRETMRTGTPQEQSQVRAQGRTAPPRADTDDASPTGGAFADTFGSSMDRSTTSDAPTWMQERGRGVREEGEATPLQKESAARKPQVQLPWQSRKQEDDPFAFGGETSAPSAPSTSSQTAQRPRPTEQSGSGENAWLRLRRQAGAQGSNASDTFAFSSSEEEQQLAKPEAQKDFDDRVERERRGKDSRDSERVRRW